MTLRYDLCHFIAYICTAYDGDRDKRHIVRGQKKKMCKCVNYNEGVCVWKNCVSFLIRPVNKIKLLWIQTKGAVDFFVCLNREQEPKIELSKSESQNRIK